MPDNAWNSSSHHCLRPNITSMMACLDETCGDFGPQQSGVPILYRKTVRNLLNTPWQARFAQKREQAEAEHRRRQKLEGF